MERPGKGCDNPEALQRILILSWEKIKEHHDIEQKLKDNCRKNGYEFHGETPRDGNCFFEAIASQLNRINAEKRYSSKQLRQEITEYILQHPTIEVSKETVKLEDFIGENLDAYCDRMAKTGTWADHVVVSSMAKMLQRDLYIVLSAPSTSDGKCLLIVNGDTSGDKDPLLLGHFHEYHYQSLQPIEQNAPCFDREEMGSYVYIPIQFSADISSERSKAKDLFQNCPVTVTEDTTGEKDPLLLGHFHEWRHQSLEQNASTFDGEEMAAVVPPSCTDSPHPSGGSTAPIQEHIGTYYTDFLMQPWKKLEEDRIKQLKVSYLHLLKKNPDIKESSLWKDVQQKIMSDWRYEEVNDDSLRKEWFDEYLLKENYFNLLKENPSITESTTWDDVKQEIKSDRRYQEVHNESLNERWYNEYVLAKVKGDYLKLLKETPNINESTPWEDIQQKIKSDPRYQAVNNDSKRENWFDEYVLTNVKEYFMKFLEEKSDIEWKDIRPKVLSDPRLRAVKIDLLRDAWFTTYRYENEIAAMLPRNETKNEYLTEKQNFMNILKEISETDLPANWYNGHYQSGLFSPLCPRVVYMRSRWFVEYKAEVAYLGEKSKKRRWVAFIKLLEEKCRWSDQQKENAFKLIDDYIEDTVNYLKELWKNCPDLESPISRAITFVKDEKEISLIQAIRESVIQKHVWDRDFLDASRNLNEVKADFMSFMDLKHSNDDIDAWSGSKWMEDMDILAQEDLFGNHVEKIGAKSTLTWVSDEKRFREWRKDLVELLGLPETNCNPAKQTKPNPTLQVLFSSWDELKPKIENEDAYMVLSNEERVEVLKDYLEKSTKEAMRVLIRNPLPPSVWFSKYHEAVDWWDEYFAIKRDKKDYFEFLDSLGINKFSRWDDVKQTIKDELKRGIYLWIDERSARYLFHEYVDRGCMVCRHTTRLTREMIDRNLPVLKRGDHIGMPLKKRLFGTVLKHHAIVDSYKVRDDKMPELSVIEVGLEGGEKKVMKIEASKCDRKLEDITLIEYEKRKYDHTETYNRANKWVKDKGQQGANDSDSETHYRLLTRNCEHFAAACVNGPTQFSPGYMKSVSVQSAKLCWLVLDICIALSQCACFIVNFNDYITNSVWAELAICEAAFLVVFIVIVLSEYLLFKRRTFGVCKECLCARRIIFLVKAFLFAITEIGNGFLVQPLNGATEDVTWVLRVSISTVEAVSIMFVAPCLTKCLIFCLGSKRCTQCSKCCSQCLCNICNFEKGSYKYVVHHIVCHDINVCVRHCCLYFGRCICEPNEQTVDEESDIIYI